MISRKRYLEKVVKYIDKPVIKVITGMRRVGKSFFLKQIMEYLSARGIQSEQIIYINMELMQYNFLKDYKDVYQYISDYFKGCGKPGYIFIDEIQEIDQWEKAINSFLAEGNFDIYITGSNSNLLSSELSTFLSGRYIEFNIYSLGFDEFLLFRAEKKKDLKTEFNHYLRFGGFPVIHYFDLDEELIYQYVNSIYNTILLKDVIARYKLRNIRLFNDVVNFTFGNLGHIFSSNSISKYLKNQNKKVGVETIQSYLQYLQESYLIHKVQRYDIKGKRVFDLYEKYYLGDISLKNAITGYKVDDISGMLENLVFLKLKREGYQVFIGKYDDFEVDFIAEKNGSKKYYQVAYLLHRQETIEREFSVLEKIKDNYPKYVITMDDLPPADRNGIRRMHIIDFLLEED